jgi:hypothetical protein
MKKEKEPSKKYYTDKHPSGSWSRALYQMRTGKPFDEKEFQEELEENQEAKRIHDEA